jgi:thioredoxin-like negative regulator of GroEL
LGRNPSLGELQSYAKSGATNVGVNIGGEKKFSEKTAEFDAGRFNEIKSAAANTTDVLSNIQAAKSILASGKLETGAIAPAKARIAAISQGLGINPGVLGLENADTAQAFQGVVMKNLLQELVKQKGPQTEGDAQRAMKTFAQLGNTP